MDLLLQREFGANATPGQLEVDSRPFCYTLEDPIREVTGIPVAQWKIVGNTAIPAGRYRVVMDMSQRFGRNMLHVLDVPGFSGIRFHNGISAHNTEGCILVNYRRDPLDEERLVDYDRSAMLDLEARVSLALFNGEDVWLDIYNPKKLEVAHGF